MVSKGFFPSIWANDDEMTGLMSMIKSREVNPNDYERKIDFWSDMVAKSCSFERNPVFNIDTLKRRFRRDDQIPSSLDVVVMSMDDYNGRSQNWFQRGYKAVVGSIWGASGDSQMDYVHLPTIHEQAERVLEFFRREYAVDDDILPEIVDSAEFYRECKSMFANKRAYDLCLAELVHRGEVCHFLFWC
ncbi:unnamed protein product [Gongylonema pulchrum]|uniref:DUF4253 domain-containing protein n=1 Tax=Gongylonema pulchrum TaxID=637853 RepID=A0A183EIW4_9BILA|nr:unnamed protein product [Gongylonema pulchrum]